MQAAHADQRTLQGFAEFDTVAALVGGLGLQGNVPVFTPRITREGRSVIPGEPGYDEAGSPEGRGKWTVNR